MSDRKIPIDQVHLTELIRNPVIVRIVSIIDLASLSILERCLVYHNQVDS